MNELNPLLVRSFAENRGSRGAHFYDETKCEFVPWNDIAGDVKDRLPETFYDKLIEAVANFDPESEFVTVSAGQGQITIELFKSHEV